MLVEERVNAAGKRVQWRAKSLTVRRDESWYLHGEGLLEKQEATQSWGPDTGRDAVVGK